MPLSTRPPARVLHDVGDGGQAVISLPWRAFRVVSRNPATVPLMGDTSLSADDIRAAAEVHGELGPEYGDAVVESFLAKIDRQIEARVDQRLASMTKRGRQPVDPIRLSKYRLALAGAAVGSVVVGLPLSVMAVSALSGTGRDGKLILFWVVLVAVYGLAAYRLRRR
jgi:hypothetical protein